MIRCKMFAGTLVSTTLDWLNNLLGGSITFLEVFTKLFVAHFVANKENLWRSKTFLRLSK